MKKKFWFILLAVLSVFCLAFGLTACGGEKAHVHTFETGWTHDGESHWHAADCGHASERSDIAAHTYKNGKCTVCDYEHEAHTFEEYSERTEKGHAGTCSVCGKTVTEAHRYEEGVCADCEYEHETHTFEEYSERTEEGHAGTCSVCGKKVSKQHNYKNGACTDCGYAHSKHTFGADNRCTVCGAGIYTKSADGKIYFGEYPQTNVKDENDSDRSLRNSLGMAAGSNPTSSNAGKWTSYRYYLNDAVSDYMWFIDVEYQNNRYRGVYFTEYRPYFTKGGFQSTIYQEVNGYTTNTIYWFKYEPIEWRILEQKDGTALLMANIILDSQQYYMDSATNRSIDSNTVYPNNYKESDIRAWLNGTFCNTAFNADTKKIIETTTVDNSAASMPSHPQYDSGKHASANTADKVFLLSWQDMLSSAYGFSSSETAHDKARQLKGTDYAKSQGLEVLDNGNSRWLLRTPTIWGDANVYNVTYDGAASDQTVSKTNGGVVPVLRIRL